MAKHKIAWMPGDGVGRDVLEAARIVLDALKFDAQYIPGEIGWEFWKKEGNPLPDQTWEVIKETECCFFGAITSKSKDDAQKELNPELKDKGFSYVSPLLTLRQGLKLHTNLRPCKAYPGNPLNYREEIDLVIFRENTEGLYAGVEFHPLPQKVKDVLLLNPAMKKFSAVPLEDIAVSCRVITRSGARSILRQGFDYAAKYGYKSVTVVEKVNVLRETSGLMIREARQTAKEYPGIEYREANIDAFTMWVLKNPLDYGVVVTSNMFGDILSDLCAQLVGGLGFAPSGNIGDRYAIFEPTHGSAPKYAGQYKVNPMATLLSAKMMLDYLGEKEMASRLEKAVAGVIAEGRVRTYDMGGSSSTLEMARAVAAKLK